MPKLVTSMVAVYVYRSREGGVEFLQLRRADGDYLGGTWQTVAGTVEDGETAGQAILRELREETGLVPTAFHYVDTVSTFYMPAEDAIYHCVNFAAEVRPDDEIRLNHEHDGHRWVKADSVDEAFMWPGQRRAVREVIVEIIEGGPAKEKQRLDLT